MSEHIPYQVTPVGLKAGDRVVVRPDFLPAADALERDSIGIIERVYPSNRGVPLVDVRFSPERLDQGLRADALELVPEREVTVGRSNHGTDS